ncbi:MAG: hypothetical protein JNM46_06045, partial [Anaerolineales bacterium]|nr:hypothetical protein [Anaerolineales bacterium]
MKQLLFINYKLRITHHFLTFSLLAVLLTSCQPQAVTQDPNIAMTAAIETAFAEISKPTDTPVPSETPIPTATVPRTPPALPSTFQTGLISPESPPRNYVADVCQYLKNKWDSTKSSPGTVVMVIMSHRIDQDATTSNAGTTTISAKDLKQLMNDLH